MRLLVGTLGLVACVGCLAERPYLSKIGGTTTEGEIAAVAGSVGQLQGIDDRFGSDWNDSLVVDRTDDQLWASMIVGHPNGRVYLDVEIYNFDKLVPNEPVTAVVTSGDEYAMQPTTGDAPQVYIYACPEGLNGENVGDSGDAAEVNVTMDDHDRITFEAVNERPEQQLFLGGWLTARP